MVKNISISCDGKTQKGEAIITKFGLEGNAIYGLSPQIRATLKSEEKARIYIDFKPTFSLEEVTLRVKNSSFKNTTQILVDQKRPFCYNRSIVRNKEQKCRSLQQSNTCKKKQNS